MVLLKIKGLKLIISDDCWSDNNRYPEMTGSCFVVCLFYFKHWVFFILNTEWRQRTVRNTVIESEAPTSHSVSAIYSLSDREWIFNPRTSEPGGCCEDWKWVAGLLRRRRHPNLDTCERPCDSSMIVSVFSPAGVPPALPKPGIDHKSLKCFLHFTETVT